MLLVLVLLDEFEQASNNVRCAVLLLLKLVLLRLVLLLLVLVLDGQTSNRMFRPSLLWLSELWLSELRLVLDEDVDSLLAEHKQHPPRISST